MENIIYTDKDWIRNVMNGPDTNDFKSLNNRLKSNKNIYLHFMKNWWIPNLPELERFSFSDNNIEEAVELLKNNTVKTLEFKFGPKNKYDLKNLFIFKDTLEELILEDGKNYINIESVINEMKKLRRLEVTSIEIDFTLLTQNRIEHFYYCGSKTKEWAGIIKFKKLKHLHIHSNTTLTNIDFLQEFKDLEKLHLLYCSNIKRFPDLSGLNKLIEINATDCNRLEDISELKKLNGVEIHLNSKMLKEKFYHVNIKKN